MKRFVFTIASAIALCMSLQPVTAFATGPEEEPEIIVEDLEGLNQSLKAQSEDVILPFLNIDGLGTQNKSVSTEDDDLPGPNETEEDEIPGGDPAPVPVPQNLATVATVEIIAKVTYTGKQIKPVPVVTLRSSGIKLVSGTDYTVSWGANKNAGAGTVLVTGKGSYTGSIKATFTIAKAKNKITKVTKKKVIKVGTLSKKRQTFKIAATVKGKAKKTFKVASVSKKAKKYISVNRAGVVVVKKGLGEGTYKIKVKITAKATKNYKKTTVTKTVRVVVQ